MPRPPAIRPTSAINTHLDEELRTRLDLKLFSEVEGRIPTGAYKRFFETQIRKFFSFRQLDLAPFVGSQPGERLVEGPEETIELLKSYLERSER